MPGVQQHGRPKHTLPGDTALEQTQVSTATIAQLLTHSCLRRADEEITISYGRHTDEVLALEYGFLPEGGNPHNDVLLFQELEEIVAFLASLQGRLHSRAQLEQTASRLRDRLPPDGTIRCAPHPS